MLPSTVDSGTGRWFAPSAGWNRDVLLGHLFLVHHLTGLVPNNGVLWSIGVEWWIYFWFLPFLWLWRRVGGFVACLSTVIITFALAVVHDYSTNTDGILYPLRWLVFPQYLGLFALGAAAAYIALGTNEQMKTVRQHPLWLPLGAFSFLVLAAIVAKLGWERAYHHISLLDLFIAVSVPALLIACQQERWQRLRRLLGIKPLAFVGVFSYSLYLIHYPLSIWVLPRIFAQLPNASQTTRFLIIFALFAPLLALAYGFYRAFEAPFHKIARRF